MSTEVGKTRKKAEISARARCARFCEEYRRIGIAYRAALLAGYTPRMAHSKSYQLADRFRALDELPETNEKDSERPACPEPSAKQSHNPPAKRSRKVQTEERQPQAKDGVVTAEEKPPTRRPALLLQRNRGIVKPWPFWFPK